VKLVLGARKYNAVILTRIYAIFAKMLALPAKTLR
jgi:hypothetical protein